jgi:hypothetical protein
VTSLSRPGFRSGWYASAATSTLAVYHGESQGEISHTELLELFLDLGSISIRSKLEITVVIAREVGLHHGVGLAHPSSKQQMNVEVLC